MNKSVLILLVALSRIGFSQVGPNDGGTFSNVAMAGSTSSWANAGNVQTSDNSYVSNSTSLAANGNYTDYLETTDFGFLIPATAIIDGITVEVERWNAGGKNAKDNQISVVKAGTIGATDRSALTNWATADPNTYATYGGATDLWGETWAPSDINGAGFGAAVSARRSQGGGGSADPRVDHVRITVYYTDFPLPIELLSFTGEPSDGKNKLRWSVASQNNNDYFSIERSADGNDWRDLGRVEGAGSSSEKLDYTYLDADPPRESYYRLSQTDYNGARAYFNIVSVINYNRHISIFPNPFDDCLIITGISNPRVVITDGVGCKKEFTSNRIDTKGLQPGYYVVDVFLGIELLKRGVFIK